MGKQWRPSGWTKDIKNKIILEYIAGADPDEPDLGDIFEAGADAMLDALKVGSMYASGLTEIGEVTSKGIEMAQKQETGWWVFIPDA